MVKYIFTANTFTLILVMSAMTCSLMDSKCLTNNMESSTVLFRGRHTSKNLENRKVVPCHLVICRNDQQLTKVINKHFVFENPATSYEN